MAKNDIRIYTFIDEGTLRLFNSARIKEGINTYSEYLRLIVTRYLHEEPETNKLVSRDRVSQNYQDLYAEIVSQSEEIKLLTSVILILAAQQSRNTDNPLTTQTVNEALHRATALMKDNDEIGPAAIEKMMRDILGSSNTQQSQNTATANMVVQDTAVSNSASMAQPQNAVSPEPEPSQAEDDNFNPNELTVTNFNHKLFKKEKTKEWWKKVYTDGEDEDTISDSTKREVVYYETAEESPTGRSIIEQGYSSGDTGVEWINGYQAIENDLVYQTTGVKPYSYVGDIDIPKYLNRWSDKEGRCILPEDAK